MYHTRGNSHGQQACEKVLTPTSNCGKALSNNKEAHDNPAGREVGRTRMQRSLWSSKVSR